MLSTLELLAIAVTTVWTSPVTRHSDPPLATADPPLDTADSQLETYLRKYGYLGLQRDNRTSLETAVR